MLRCHPREAYLRSQLTLPLQGQLLASTVPIGSQVMIDAEAGSGSDTAANADITFTSAWPIARPKMGRPFPRAA